MAYWVPGDIVFISISGAVIIGQEPDFIEFPDPQFPILPNTVDYTNIAQEVYLRCSIMRSVQ